MTLHDHNQHGGRDPWGRDGESGNSWNNQESGQQHNQRDDQQTGQESSGGHDSHAPSVTSDNVLGSMDSLFGALKSFMQEQSGAAHGDGWDALLSLTNMLQTLSHELTKVGGAGGGSLTPESNQQSVANLQDQSAHGSVGNLEQDSKPHGHNLLPPHQTTDHRFDLETSSRISRNSFGPLINERLRRCCSS